MEITKTEVFNLEFANKYCRKDCDYFKRNYKENPRYYHFNNCSRYNKQIKQDYNKLTHRCDECIKEFGLGDEIIEKDNMVPLTEEELLIRYREYLKLYNGTSKCPQNCKRLYQEMDYYWCAVEDSGIRVNSGITRTDECAYDMKKQGFPLFKTTNNKL